MKTTWTCLVVAVVLSGLSTDTSAQPSGDPGTFTTKANAYFLFMRALTLEGEGDLAGAQQSFEEAARLDPGAAGIPAALAELHARQNRVGEAIAAGERALELDPDNTDAHRVLGLVFAALAEQTAERSAPAAEADRARSIQRAVEHLERFQEERLFDARAMFTLGRLYMETGSLDEAVVTLERFVEQRPDFFEALRLLARAYGGVDRRADAARMLEELVRRRPRSFRALTDLAELYEQDGRWADAADAYRRAVARRPQDLDLKRRWATAVLNAGNSADARNVLDEVLEARASDAGALYLLSEAERRLTRFDAAEAAARRLIEIEPDGIRGFYALGQVFLQRREYAKLVATLEPVIAGARANDRVRRATMLLVQTGLAHQALGDDDRAIEAFGEASAASPDDASLQSYVGAAYLKAGRVEDALTSATAARERHPGDFRLAGLEARALVAAGQAERGITAMRSAVREHDDDPNAHIALANLFVETGRVDDAVRTLEAADSRFPTETAILFQLGAIFEQQRQFADAERALRTVLERDPLHHQALNYLGYMLADRGERLQESVELITRALESDPHNGSYLDSLGWAYFKLNQLEPAETYLRRASEQLTQNSVIQDHFGDVLFEQGRYAEAIEVWERALRGDADSIDPAAVERKIRDARGKLGR